MPCRAVSAVPWNNDNLQNNLTALIYSLVNGLYNITTESIKLVLEVEQSGVSSD